MLRFAFNTRSAAGHRLPDALELIAEAGYQGVALTLAWPHFDLLADSHEADAQALASLLREYDLALAVETRAPFALDPREPFEPTLLHPAEEGRARRLDALRRAVRVAAICGGACVSFSSGRPRRNVSQANAGVWLLDGLTQMADLGAAEGVTVALEPVPGEMVATVDDFQLVREALKQATDAPLSLALGVGHSLVTEDREPHSAIKEFAPVLARVSLGDRRRRAPEALPLGSGDLDGTATLAALEEVGFSGLVTVDVPHDSDQAHAAIPESLDWLQDNLPSD